MNVGGSTDKLVQLLQHEVDINLVQEHRLTVDMLPGVVKRLSKLGWHGVWSPADITGEHAHARSGGVAVLVPRHVLISQGCEQATARCIRATIPLTRTKSVHVFSVYAYDAGYANRDVLNGTLFSDIQATLAMTGRIPWAVGGDFNCEPNDGLPGWHSGGTIVDCGKPTHRLGGNLGWFLIAPGWRRKLSCGMANAQVQEIVGDHVAVGMRLRTAADLELGIITKKPTKIVSLLPRQTSPCPRNLHQAKLLMNSGWTGLLELKSG